MTDATIKVDDESFISRLNTLLYADRRTVVDELVQNAQRAGADRVEMSANDHVFRFEDDGCGCEPEDLLTLADTGWDDEVVEDVDPFGLGFWSIMLLEGHVNVWSGSWKMSIDVPRMIDHRTVDVVDITENPTAPPDGIDGMIVEVASPNYGDHKKFTYRGAFKRAVRYAPFDEAQAGTTDVTTGLSRDEYHGRIPDYSKPFHFDLDGVECLLIPAEKSYTQPTLYYQDRPVGDLDGVRHMKGHVFVDDDEAIGVRAPDRKEPINDDRLDALVDKVEGLARQTLEPVIRSRSRETNKLSDAVRNYYDADELSGAVRFESVDDEDLEESPDVDDESDDEIDPPSDESTASDGGAPFTSTPRVSSGADADIEDDDEENAHTVWDNDDEADGVSLDDLDGHAMWVRDRNVGAHRDAIRTARGAGVDVFVAHTGIERYVASNDPRLLKVEAIERADEVDVRVGPVEADVRTQRAAWVVECAAERFFGRDVVDVEVGELKHSLEVGDVVVDHHPDDINFVVDGTRLLADVDYLDAAADEVDLGEYPNSVDRHDDVQLLLQVADDLAVALAQLEGENRSAMTCDRKRWRRRLNDLAIGLLGDGGFDLHDDEDSDG